jgi:hypothetical protein
VVLGDVTTEHRTDHDMVDFVSPEKCGAGDEEKEMDKASRFVDLFLSCCHENRGKTRAE